MSLLQKLEDVRVVKQNYFVLQHRFYGELSKRFPYLMNKDMAKLANKIEKELHTLLCASLRYKSIKVRLAATAKWGHGKTYVNVQRTEPGFYYSHSQRGSSDIHYMDLDHYITNQDDMYEVCDKDDDGNSTKDELLVALSELKNAGNQIIPEKLDVYFKFLREIMIYHSKFLCYTEARNQKADASFFIKGLQFRLQPKSMNVLIAEKDLDEYYNNGSSGYFRYAQDHDNILHMLDYNEETSTNFDKNIHDRLKLFINHYKEICAKFEYEEKKKRKVYKTCLSFIKQMRVHTLPFKVLNEIIKK